MLQIKTIIGTTECYDEFDKQVNAALADGWYLIKRDVLAPYISEGIEYARCLIAELEREIITDEEKCCENCAYRDCAENQDPCRSCGEDADKWEAAE